MTIDCNDNTTRTNHWDFDFIVVIPNERAFVLSIFNADIVYKFDDDVVDKLTEIGRAGGLKNIRLTGGDSHGI